MPGRFVTHLKYSVLSIRIPQTQRRGQPPRKKTCVYIYIYINIKVFYHEKSGKHQESGSLTRWNVCKWYGKSSLRRHPGLPNVTRNQRPPKRHLITGSPHHCPPRPPRHLTSKSKTSQCRRTKKNGWTFPWISNEMKARLVLWNCVSILFYWLSDLQVYLYIYIYISIHTYLPTYIHTYTHILDSV